jgi:sulfatase maturation enzyme AslB (radical SAM superfamily)
MSFLAILDQVIEAVDVTYMGGEPLFTKGLKFQAKLTFYKPN